MSRATRTQHVTLIIVGFIVWGWLVTGCRGNADSNSARADFTDLHVFEQAFKNRQSNLQVTQQGEIIRILSDDTKGSQHQRCIVKLASGQTLLIAHNIDIAPRVPNMKTGKQLIFHGEYEWNEEGGVIHWTHHDPNGQHKDGWLEYQGKIYQ